MSKITSIREKMRPLLDWYRRHKPEVRVVTLSQDDYDELKLQLTGQQGRIPEVAQAQGFSLNNGEIYVDNFKLKRQ